MNIDKLEYMKNQQNLAFQSSHSVGNSRSNTKFVIRYEQKQLYKARSNIKTNRYSSKYEYEQLRSKKIPESLVQKNRIKFKEGNTIPSYLKPTEASISAQLQRNRIASMADINNQNKMGSVLKHRSKSLEEQQNQNQKQYNRVPIQFYDQKNNGCGADYLRARVIYRGYAPKNTYYYLKTLKRMIFCNTAFRRRAKKLGQQLSCQLIQQGPVQAQKINASLASASSINLIKQDFDVKFQSKFESGNLSAVSRISLNQYWVYMREDTNTHGLRQWYYFVITNKKPIKMKIRIYKFTKSYSLYRIGMKPYIRTCLNQVVKQWQQGGEKVKYEFDNNQKCYYLEFQYRFEQQNQQTQFSMLPPYTYTMLKQYLRTIQPEKMSLNEIVQQKQISSPVDKQQTQVKVKKSQKTVVQVRSIGQTLAGLDIPLIQIRKYTSKTEFSTKNRQCIVVLARTHPGETVSNFSLEAFIDTILINQQIIQCYDFFIVPMVNPDGVYFGNHRTSIIGQDLNRNFNTTDFQIFPQIQAVHNAVNLARKSHKIRFLIDLHGHSARKNIFAYGDQQQMGSTQYLHTRILPKLLNDAISSFKYQYCVFKQSKQKKNTARVFYSNKFKINCLTIEQSYGILDQGPMGIHIWRNFGVALANCLLEFYGMYKKGKQGSLQEYLKEEIKKQKQIIQKLILKHRKMLGLDAEQANQKQNQMTNIKQSSSAKQNGQQITISNQLNQKNEQQTQNIKQTELKLQLHQNQDQHQNQNQNQSLQQQQSVRSSELSSGDQQLEMKDDQIQMIKKDIYRIGCLKEGVKRQKYNIADKRLQLFENSQSREDMSHRRLHQQKSSMIPRIVKLQLKRKQEYNQSFKRQFRQSQRDIIQKQRLERRKEIETKFKRMELPIIRK